MKIFAVFQRINLFLTMTNYTHRVHRYISKVVGEGRRHQKQLKMSSPVDRMGEI